MAELEWGIGCGSISRKEYCFGAGVAMRTLEPPAGIKICTVSELTRAVNMVLGEAFPSIWVAGEIANLKRWSSGHIYLILKDAQAQVGAIVWRSTATRLRFQLQDGLQIIARGNLNVYP